jgi:hypothetical protein
MKVSCEGYRSFSSRLDFDPPNRHQIPIEWATAKHYISTTTDARR